MKRLALAALFALSLAGCREETVALAPPVTLTADAVGRYCGMNLSEHEGPKGQVVLSKDLGAYWFSSARDTVGGAIAISRVSRTRRMRVIGLSQKDRS